MASRRMLNHSGGNQVHTFRIRGRSASQVSLRKIINTICSFPRPRHLLNEKPSSKKKKSDCKFDLNLPLSSAPPPPSESNKSVVVCDSTEPENSGGEDCPETEIAVGDVDKSKICTRESPPSDLRNCTISSKRNASVPRGSEGYLELLIEAAELLSDSDDDEDFEEEIGTAPNTKPISRSEESRKRKHTMRMQNDSTVGNRRRSNRLKESENVTAAAAAATATEERKVSPGGVSVTRSRSGRCQVIPWKYRDSDFERDKSATAATTIRR